jgi:hypothetical protein
MIPDKVRQTASGFCKSSSGKPQAPGMDIREQGDPHRVKLQQQQHPVPGSQDFGFCINRYAEYAVAILEITHFFFIEVVYKDIIRNKYWFLSVALRLKIHWHRSG